MPESIEVQLTRIATQMSFVFRDAEEAKAGRKHQYETNEAIKTEMQDIKNRLETLEESMTKASPTIEEFITIKHKVVGAGLMGKWLWAIGAFIIGLCFSARKEILEWIS